MPVEGWTVEKAGSRVVSHADTGPPSDGGDSRETERQREAERGRRPDTRRSPGEGDNKWALLERASTTYQGRSAMAGTNRSIRGTGRVDFAAPARDTADVRARACVRGCGCVYLTDARVCVVGRHQLDAAPAAVPSSTPYTSHRGWSQAPQWSGGGCSGGDKGVPRVLQ